MARGARREERQELKLSEAALVALWFVLPRVFRRLTRAGDK
jgi:hypothetical protein